MDLLGLAFCLPFFVAAIMSHLGVNFTQENFDGFEDNK